MVTAILLAAGSSRRMGPPNKLLLPYDGRPLVVATAENILAANVGEIILVTGHESEALAAAVSSLPIKTIHNPHYAEGMTSSIRAGASIARGRGLMICLADMVRITPAEYILIKTAFEQQYDRDVQCIVLPEYQGQKGNPVVFSSAYRDAILAHPEEDGCRSLVRGHPQNTFRLAMPTPHILQDIDSPDDYQRLIHRSQQ
jgi:molybdenum cofactor cytidylyltransferase